MRGLPPKTLPLRVAFHGDASLLNALAADADQLLLSPVDSNLEITARVAQADVILVDVAFLGQVGLDEIAGLRFDRPVLAIANKDQVAATLKTGVRGVLLKGATVSQIEAALQAVHVGLTAFDRSIRPDTAAPSSGAHASPNKVDDVQLTKREQEVIVLMAEGLSNKQIAAKLTISEHTAKFHVNSILQKMNAQKRVEAVVRAAQRGILSL